MIIRANYESGSFFYLGREYPIKDHHTEVPLAIAKKMVLSGQYAPQSKYDYLTKKCENMLMIRGSGLGDIMFCHPIRRQLKQTFPGLKIDFMTSDEYKGLVAYDDTYDRLVNIHALNERKYDFVMNLNNIEFHGTFSQYHKIDLFMHLFGLSLVKDKTLFYKMTKRDQDWANSKNIDDNVIAVVIKSTCESKHMKMGRLAGVLQHLSKKYSFMLFDKSRKIGNELIKLIGRGGFYNCCGKYNIRQCAALLSRCRGVFTPDTGFLHLATALGCKVVAYFGSIGHKLVITPGDIEIIHSNISCYPCNRFDCPRGHNECVSFDQKILASKIAEKIG